jgi:hypothetical protein
MAEELRFDITGNTAGAQRANRDLAGTMDLAARGARLMSDSLDKQKRAVDAAARASLTLAKTEKILKDATDEAIASEVEQRIALERQKRAAEEAAAANTGLGASTTGAASGLSGMVTPITALVTAGVALAPAVVTLGFGLAGLGVAAAGVVSPILKAAKASGGLQANLAKLDPEQQTVARSILSLRGAYDRFQKSLEPVLLKDFSSALALAAPLLKDIQPVAQSTGVALARLFSQVGATFRSGEWQQFFGFMARTAAPDLNLLGQSFTNLLKTLPPLLEQLQPVATDILAIAAASTKLIQAGASTSQNLNKTGHSMGALQQVTTALRLALFAPGVGLYHALKLIGVIGPDAKAGIQGTGAAAGAAAGHVQTLAEAVNTLNAAESKSLDTQLAYSNALIAAGNDAQTLRQALRASSGAVGTHTAAQRASFSAANTYISDLRNAALAAVASGHGATGAARAIQNGLPILEQAARHNHQLWIEVQILKQWLDKLRLEPAIREKINVLGIGSWSATAATHKIAQGPGPFAAGGRVPGAGNSDSFPAMLTPGEAVVPKRLVPAVAPFLHANQVPGFAAGGLAGGYHGDVAGLKPWSRHNLNVSAAQITAGIGNAMASAFHRALSSFGGFGPGGRGGGGPGTLSLGAIERLWTAAGGPGGGWAHIAAAITGAESGFRPGAVQQGQPYATTGWGLWQITPGNSEPQFGVNQALLNPMNNAGAAVAKFRGAGYTFAPWTTFMDGAYLQFMDRGGWLPPGVSHVYNGTGRPEQLVPGRGGSDGQVVVLEVRSGGTRLDDAIVEIIRRAVKVRGGGNVQVALGRRGA